MPHLAPCSHCLRHVRVDVTACPFCGGGLCLDPTPPALPTRRLGRAAAVAFGTVVATAAVACGNGRPAADGANAGAASASGEPSASETAKPGETAKPSETGTTTATTPTAPNNKPYGAPPADGLLV